MFEFLKQPFFICLLVRSIDSLAANCGDGIVIRCSDAPKNPSCIRPRKQFTASGACRKKPEVKLCLACGRIATEAERRELRKYFTAKGWELWDEHWLRERLQSLSKGVYENQISAVVAKLLLRGKVV
jgi:hypothetical protein